MPLCSTFCVRYFEQCTSNWDPIVCMHNLHSIPLVFIVYCFFYFLKGFLGDRMVAVKFLDPFFTVMTKGKSSEIDRMMELTECDHIVKIIASETYSGTLRDGHLAIIMEICDGSLSDEIKICPFGLSDGKILNVISGLKGAIEYMVLKKKIIHRDVKPANILRKNGVYKLGDFGGAIKMTSNGRISTIDGTEEYAHPKLFKAMVAHETKIYPDDKYFDDRIDLWSIGVTIYQTIVGRLPFQPKEGVRCNRLRMLKILADKPYIAIGASDGADGTVTYYEQLPKMTIASEEIKKLIDPLLIQLFEVISLFFF